MGDREGLLKRLADLLVQTMKDQIALAGHVMTGDLLNSVSSMITTTVTSAKIEVLLNDYGIALDQGVPPDRIPFTPIPPYRGGRSAYIEGLARFATLKLGASSPREALGIAFAIANKHKRTGMPVKGPSEFIQKTLDATEADIEQFVEEWAASVFEVQLDTLIGNIAA